MLISSLLELVAADLNDRQHTVWSVEQLRAYIQEGFNNAFVRRPDSFMDEKVIKVEPCVTYQEVCECSSIRRVIGQSTKDGRIIKELRKRTNKDRLKWPGEACDIDLNNFELDEYSVDSKTNKLRVFPAVPAGLDIYVVVECSVSPDDLNMDDDMDGVISTAVHQWALFCARMVDAENNPAVFDVARTHEVTFWRILKAQEDKPEVDSDKDGESNERRTSS